MAEDETMADFWRDLKPAMQEASQQRRASNRDNSAALLRANGVQFESKNGGAHLIVRDGTYHWNDTPNAKAHAARLTAAAKLLRAHGYTVKAPQ